MWLPIMGAAGTQRVPKSSGGCVPAQIMAAAPITVDQVGLEIGTPEAGKSIRVLVYAPGPDGFPVVKVIDQLVSCAAAGNSIATLPAPVELSGFYWGFVMTDSLVATSQCFGVNPASGQFGTFNQVRVGMAGGPLFDCGTYAAPADVPIPMNNSSWGSNNNPLISLRRAS